MAAAATGRELLVGLPWADLLPTPWNNGAGFTRQLASVGSSWRVSVADISAQSRFSVFPGVDRRLLIVTGEGLHLTVDGRGHDVEPYVPLAFRGESVTTCEVAHGPVRVLNIMTARVVATGSLEVVDVRESHTLSTTPGESIVLVQLRGELIVKAGKQRLALNPLDGARWTGSGNVSAHGDGAVAVARVRLAHGSPGEPRH